MNAAPSLLLNLTARLLEPREREVVLGDLEEADAGLLQSVSQVLDLGIRRHAALWTDWRPWLTGPGLTLPASFLLMGVSLSVSQACLELANSAPTPAAGVTWLLTQVCLLLGWSWTCGFVVGSLSPRTVWASIVLCGLPCFVCLSRFHLQSLSPVCLLWFLIPAGLGLCQGARGSHISLRGTLGIAVALTSAMLIAWHSEAQRWWSPPWWLIDGVMSWPALYLVARAGRSLPRRSVC
jgi:hypothetical protein